MSKARERVQRASVVSNSVMSCDGEKKKKMEAWWELIKVKWEKKRERENVERRREFNGDIENAAENAGRSKSFSHMVNRRSKGRWEMRRPRI